MLTEGIRKQRPIFDNDYLPSVYQSSEPPNAHKLAVVYLVMALGVMFDLERREPCEQISHLSTNSRDMVLRHITFALQTIPLQASCFG